VAGSLRRDSQPVVAGVLNDRAYVVQVEGHRHESGSLVDCEVPRLASRIPPRLARRHDPASDRGDEVGKRVGHGS
jgi:hypothetical protein